MTIDILTEYIISKTILTIVIFQHFSRDLVGDMAEAISLEVRAHYNNLSKPKAFYGITCFSPVINIMRHPLWGRNQVSDFIW